MRVPTGTSGTPSNIPLNSPKLNLVFCGKTAG
jgi:hypothetical protein